MGVIDRISTSLAHSKRKVNDFFCDVQIISRKNSFNFGIFWRGNLTQRRKGLAEGNLNYEL